MTATSPPALVTTDGRRWSWSDLVDEFHPAIEAFARSRGIRDAADVAGDVFAAALPRLDGFTGTSRDLRSFLFTIAHRRVADEHRRFYRRPERLTGMPPDAPAPGGPDDEVIDRDDARTAFGALAILDQRAQQVLLLRIVEERSTEEVAAELGLSAANVRKVQSRALRRIRRHLEKDRHTRAGRAMALVVAPLIRLRGDEPLPTGGPVGEWIVSLRAEAAAAGAHSAAEACALVSAAVATSGAAVAVSASTTATVAATAATGGTLMKTSLTLSVLAATSAAVGGGIAANAFETDTSVAGASEAVVEIDDETAADTELDGEITADTTTDADVSIDDDLTADADTDASVELDTDDTAITADTATDADASIDDDLTAEADTDVSTSIDTDGDLIDDVLGDLVDDEHDNEDDEDADGEGVLGLLD